MCWAACRGYRRSRRRRCLSEWVFQTSRHHKLARKKAAAEGSRRENRRQEGTHNSLHPRDFEAHEPLLARPKSPMVERRTSVNRSPCGRRTSLVGRQREYWAFTASGPLYLVWDSGGQSLSAGFHRGNGAIEKQTCSKRWTNFAGSNRYGAGAIPRAAPVIQFPLKLELS